MKQGYEKRFKQGDIVYWCHSYGSGRWAVRYGMVDEQFSDKVAIDYLVPRERRLVNGIPIDQFESEVRFKRLPKGWSYDTALYEITYAPLTPEEENFLIDIRNPDAIKEAYDKGYFVKDSTVFHGVIESDIQNGGYRIVKKHPMWSHHIDSISIEPYKVYFTYAEAQQEVDEKIAEFDRQAALSNYDWSVEQIDKTLKMYQTITACSDEEVEQYRDWLLNIKDTEDVETRVFGGNIQWKYWKNKRWNYIEL